MSRRVLAVLLLLFTISAIAQTSPFLSDDLHRKLTNEISGELAFDHLRTLSMYHAIHGASRDFRAEATWVEQKAHEVGLEDVKVHTLPYPGIAWSPISSELWLIEPAKDGKPIESKIISYAEVATSLADYSRPANVEAELVDVGMGVADGAYEGKDVKGKVVLASGNPAAVETQAVWKRGALGVISYWSSRTNPFDYPDQVAWSRVHAKPDKEGHQPAWAIMVSYRTGQLLKRRLAPPMFAPKDAPKPEPVKVRVKVESEIASDPNQLIVEGWIRGSKVHDQQVILTAHMQEEKFSANDDRSGVANLLEIARALNAMIKDGRLQRPERDLRFWWVNEIDAEYTYFAENPDDRKNIFVNVNQDMVGVNQTVGGLSRVQHVTFTPWSRPTFFNDVIDSIITALYQGNNSYLNANMTGGRGLGSTFTKPIYSHLGGRDRYQIEVVPYFDSTDHMVFNDASVGTLHGGTTFTNWPDEYIHSSDDDLWQVDRTTLKRNAVAVTALAWFMANVGEKDVPVINAALVPGAHKRIAAAIQNVEAARFAGSATASDTINVFNTALAREQAAAQSVRSIAPGVTQAELETTLNSIRNSNVYVPGLKAEAVPATPNAMQIPVRVEPVKTYMEKREAIEYVRGLHPDMMYEAANFADGKRSVWDVYMAVRAESLGAGEWYYGKVTPEMIQKYFDNAVKAGAFTYKAPPPAAPLKKGTKKKK